ncbi:hypothetical protein CC80DRAFT_29155 [Byssothecium circinans]|uniref:Nudix hydrolase domain-containing protein n=1 Tax=Byssothecium circinans TaxID=147558 RepID=A0A6A5U119_9PLEO|nr:hypothetical protein CC80DRAFT_29155 [Byssothecium circinans]
MAHTTPPSTQAIFGQIASENFVQGGGVAIFHLKSARVVICSAEDRQGRTYYFLPKGRRDAGEDAGRGAEREGFEESGYRNRLLPLPIPHLQPQAYPRISLPPLTAEPVWIQFMPLDPARQYVVYWYIAETIPPALEAELVTARDEPYKAPPAFPADLTLRQRMAMEEEGYEPVKHEGTGVDEEEAGYKSFLVGLQEAVGLLGRGGVMADVVLRGWKGVEERLRAEGDEVVG